NQSGYRYQSATFSPALTIFMQVTIQTTDLLGGWKTALLQHGVLHEGHKLASLFTRGLGIILYWLNSLTLHSIGKPIKHRVGGYTYSVHTIFFFAGSCFLTLYSIGNPIKH